MVVFRAVLPVAWTKNARLAEVASVGRAVKFLMAVDIPLLLASCSAPIARDKMNR